MTSTRELWREILAPIRAEYRRLGFRSDGSFFYRLSDAGRVVACVEYTKDWRYEPECLHFSVGLSVFMLRLYDPRRQELPFPRLRHHENPHWEDSLTPDGSFDYAWEIEPGESPAALIAWHVEAASTLAVPRLDEVASEGAQFALLSEGAELRISEKQVSDYLGALRALRAGEASR